ncbi:MAG: acyl-CoA dehydrogenase C-terminal domain-containing protein [Myxococcota bacterium]
MTNYYKAPIDELMFVLDAFGYDELAKMPAYEAFDRETVQALIESSATVFDEVLAPLNKKGDEEGLKWDPETKDVILPDGFREAYKTLVDEGMISITGPAEYDGGGAPEMVRAALGEIMAAANKSFSMAPGLTRDLVSSLMEHGSEEQKDFYVPKLVSGEWSGTMCLTEPQCGTDLGLVTTKAEPQEDGSYKLTGTKIWITFGEHNLTENIIHLVLARLPDAPDGIKGISTFLVPKVVDGDRNPIFCTGLEHKMGIHASPTCVMSLEGATGYMVGEAHKGMRVMFTMMNEARLYVGSEGIALGEAAYQTALAFVNDRRQSRSLNPARRDKDAKADNILVHPDVRRMLLNVKSTTEALRGLGSWISYLLDFSRATDDEERREEAEDLIALLTPIIKSYGTERGVENVSEALQVCGGSGFTTDWNIEQYYRDLRISMIYEGTNHIQALDLVGRKLPMKGGKLLQTFSKEVTATLTEAAKDDRVKHLVGPVQAAAEKLTKTTMSLSGSAMQNPEVVGAVASPYLNMFALVTLGYIWVRMVKYAYDREHPRADTKAKTAHYFMTKVLPEIHTLEAVIDGGLGNIMEFSEEEFATA